MARRRKRVPTITPRLMNPTKRKKKSDVSKKEVSTPGKDVSGKPTS
jgi:hypothetical protein